jgi:hypothetical protein
LDSSPTEFNAWMEFFIPQVVELKLQNSSSCPEMSALFDVAICNIKWSNELFLNLRVEKRQGHEM